MTSVGWILAINFAGLIGIRIAVVEQVLHPYLAFALAWVLVACIVTTLFCGMMKRQPHLDDLDHPLLEQSSPQANRDLIFN